MCLFANKTFACDLKLMICLQCVVIPTVFVNTRLNKSEGVQMSKAQLKIENLGVSKPFTIVYQQSHILYSMTSFVPIQQMKMESKK